MIVIGEHGVGKSALIGAALERLPDGWIVFEAGAAQINADAMYVGQLEGRIEDLVQRLHGRSAVWIFPAFEEALYAGTYSNHPTGMLDVLLPHVEAGTIRVVAEITPQNYELLVAKRPRVQSALRALRLRPPSEAETVRVLAHALEAGAAGVTTDETVLHEVNELAQQFLPGIAQPGGAMRLLEATVDAAVEREATSFDTGDVLASLAALSGLPLALLDPNRPLDLAEVRAFFNERVLGQEQAVGAVVDRIALVKAGLTDPTRPLGVFLFVGPTGTGKTELAKTLAQFMFGSVNRLVRLDMSEFQTPDSLERLLSDTSVDESGRSADRVRAQGPVLRRAAGRVREGGGADLGPVPPGLRRRPAHGPLGAHHRLPPLPHHPHLERRLRAPVRPRARLLARRAGLPLERGRSGRSCARSGPSSSTGSTRSSPSSPSGARQMRALLDKELEEVVHRRGIRGRPWAMEVDETAVTFLLDAGFSPTFGARPLKRAVEEHLLTPLARAMVDADPPTGDQFLFVTAPHGAIEVHFVGLDEEPAAAVPAEEEAEAPLDSEDADVRALLRRGRFDRDAQRLLLSQLAEVETRVVNEVIERKHVALERVSEPDFWEDEGRYRVLAEAEYLDRLETACRTATKLGARLRSRLEGRRTLSDADPNGAGDAELCNLLGFRVYSLERALAGLDAGAPFELFLRLRIVGEQALPEAAERLFLEQLVAMYLGWAKERGMHVAAIARSEDEVLLHAGGLGAGLILQPEAGLHILETAATKRTTGTSGRSSA